MPSFLKDQHVIGFLLNLSLSQNKLGGGLGYWHCGAACAEMANTEENKGNLDHWETL